VSLRKLREALDPGLTSSAVESRRDDEHIYLAL